MTKGPAEANAMETRDAGGRTELGSHRRLRAARQNPEQALLAFADALRDILHDELRPTG